LSDDSVLIWRWSELRHSFWIVGVVADSVDVLFENVIPFFMSSPTVSRMQISTQPNRAGTATGEKNAYQTKAIMRIKSPKNPPTAPPTIPPILADFPPDVSVGISVTRAGTPAMVVVIVEMIALGLPLAAVVVLVTTIRLVVGGGV
jgi:hypothetical protein